jgi:hypothetical protein
MGDVGADGFGQDTAKDADQRANQDSFLAMDAARGGRFASSGKVGDVGFAPPNPPPVVYDLVRIRAQQESDARVHEIQLEANEILAHAALMNAQAEAAMAQAKLRQAQAALEKLKSP